MSYDLFIFFVCFFKKKTLTSHLTMIFNFTLLSLLSHTVQSSDRLQNINPAVVQKKKNNLRNASHVAVTWFTSRVISIGMRRTLSVNVSRFISYLFNPVLAARTAESVQGFQVNLLRKLATKPPNMDLSNMRKKYKGDEEVRSLSKQ